MNIITDYQVVSWKKMLHYFPGCGKLIGKLKSVRVHFAPEEIAITLELLGQFLRFLDQNDRHSLGVLLIY